MPNRYAGRDTIDITKEEMFKQIKLRRGEDFIAVYSTPAFNRLSELDLEGIDFDSYIWCRGDNFYKLAHEFYGSPEYWWVIALFNHAPTEHHISIGEEIFIPREADSVILMMGV